MQIGLIGGIGPAATDYYYQNIIRAFEAAERELELTMVHASSRTLLQNLSNNDAAAQVEIYEKLAERLVDAGSDCIVITSIAGHFCIEQFSKTSPLPIINMILETNKAIEKLGYSNIGILGTKTVMETKFYSGITSIEITPPQGKMLEDVHEAYVSMAGAGFVSDDQRYIFDSACEWFLKEQKVDAILLGGTDLALVYQQGQAGFPVIDCASIHCDSVLNFALSND